MTQDPLAGEVSQEFAQQLQAFRRNYLMRVVALLAATVWAAGMAILLLDRTALSVGMFLGFEALCYITYRLGAANRLRPAQHLLIVGISLYSLSLAWLIPSPVLLFVPVLVAPIGIAVLESRLAILYALLLATGQIVTASQVLPAPWLSWQTILAPVMTLVAASLALLWSANLTTALGWAMHSARSAVERLLEVQEHRAQLSVSMKDLDAAVQRLERTNEMLAAARSEAESARQARNQFALTASHELRTPLNFIIGFSELMVNAPQTYARPEDWPPGLYDDIKEIYQNSNHLTRLVNDILELGQSEARRLILANEWTDPAIIAQETEGIMRAAIGARNLYFDVEVEPDLPELYVDRTRIRQVLINLIGNSLRFTEEGGISLTIRRQATDVLFSVQDTGVGIPADEIQKVFEDFGQANATVWRRRGGSGLGVPISRRFVEMHGGRIWLESIVGAGTTFFFTLPTPGALADPREAFRPDAERRYSLGPARSAKVVVVLSPAPNAGAIIEGCVTGYRVIATGHPTTAARYIDEFLPHALVVDQAIAADQDVTDLIASVSYDLPIITLAIPGTAQRTRALPAGVNGHLLKPVRRRELVDAIRALEGEVRSMLVVDDDPAMARYVELALAAAGEAGRPAIRLEAATTGLAVLDMMERRGPTGGSDHRNGLPDAILLDLKLPDMSGWDVLGALQAHPGWRSVPVILVTAADLHQEMEVRTGETLLVSINRPLTADELSGSLESLLKSLHPMTPAVSAVPEQPTGPAA